MHFTDRLTLDGALRRTSDGYAVVSARVARGGNVQTYLGSELGVTDKALVRVYRPAEAVFKKDALATYAGVPVTVGHPAAGVTAATWKDLAVGEVGEDVLRDGEFVRVPMMLRDAKAIETVEAGSRELSMGYSAELTFADGVSPAGEQFDATMSDFKMNHVAIVATARGGKELRIGDDAGKWGASPVKNHTADERTPEMDLRKVLVDGLTVETTDAGAQAISKLQSALADSAANITKLQDDHSKAIAAKDGELAKAHAERDAEKAKVVDAAALDKLVQARADLVGKAKAIAKNVVTDGLSDADIRKAVVTAVRGADAVADKSPAYLDAAFDIIAEDAAKAKPDAFRRVIQSGVHQVGDAREEAAKARADHINSLRDAWKGAPAAQH
ncbi:MAG: DUF2213 domain-containing protein [bacterium]|nr:DUF2213 domain-containing protein [bacterium]